MTTTTAIARRVEGPAVLRPNDVRQLLRAPDRRSRRGKRDAALLAILVGGGLRIGEACRLTVSNVEYGRGGVLRLRFQSLKQRTAIRTRTVTLPARAAKLVRDWIAFASPRLFLFEGRRYEALSVRRAQEIVTRYLREIGCTGNRAHDLRHTFGSMVTKETRSLFVAQSLLGHSDPRTTSLYYAAFEVTEADSAAVAVEAALRRRAL